MSADAADLSFGADAPPADEVLGVWQDLEYALAGKNSFGGDVAEIYAYRLVSLRLHDADLPPGISDATPEEEQAVKEAIARCAGSNLTKILRRFAAQHRASFAVEGPQGFRTLDLDHEDFPPFSWRVHVQVARLESERPAAPPIHVLRDVIEATTGHLEIIGDLLAELGAHRAWRRQRLGAPIGVPVGTEDLPPDAPTGLYLDRALDAEDLEWITMAWDALARRSDSTRVDQLMLVFHAIQNDARATAEFLRVMNTSVLPLLRRLRLRAQPDLARLGAANE